MLKTKLSMGLLLGASMITAPALAGSYPAKDIELVHHAGVGGGTDNNARAVVAELQKF